MAKTIVSLKANDFGEYHNTSVKMYCDKTHGEAIMIRYGWYERDHNYFPCCAILSDGKINLHRAGIGKQGDIKIDPAKWLQMLKLMRAGELYEQWEKLINHNKKVA